MVEKTINTKEILKLVTILMPILKVKRKNFDMTSFRGFSNKTKAECKNNVCETVACYLGYFPTLPFELFKIKDSDFPDEKYSPQIVRFNYYKYSENLLGFKKDSNQWRFLFSSLWGYIDNTLEGAVERTKWAIDNWNEFEKETFKFTFESFKEGWWKSNEKIYIKLLNNIKRLWK